MIDREDAVASTAGRLYPTRWSESLIRPEPWTVDALCAQVDPDMFFPEKGGKEAAAAKRVCGSCDVTAQCLAYALRTGQADGIWGGLSARQRAKLRGAA